MKNKEKFKNEIVGIVCSGDNLAVNKETYKPVPCAHISCCHCLFYDNYCVNNKLIDWGDQEYKEPIVISDKDSLFLNFIKDYYYYIARDKNERLYAYFIKPKKCEGYGLWEGGAPIRLEHFNVVFPMIKWTDEQPWKISDLKKLKVVKNY